MRSESTAALQAALTVIAGFPYMFKTNGRLARDPFFIQLLAPRGTILAFPLADVNLYIPGQDRRHSCQRPKTLRTKAMLRHVI